LIVSNLVDNFVEAMLVAHCNEDLLD